ncbi:MAG TPA: hypothetical protein VJ756_05300 [Terriglobales bacterium]|nr:hypothetical protein [Terriglobales bacterium]
MQFAKDSFYMALRERLTVVNPGRTVVMNGVTRPAILVVENEAASVAEPVADTFHIYWGGAKVIKAHSGGERPLIGLECTIAYRTAGSGEAGVDRGRSLARLDEEPLAICRPGWAAKGDYTQSPPVELGTHLMWNPPDFGETETVGEAPSSWRKSRALSGARLQRLASMTIYFFGETEQR